MKKISKRLFFVGIFLQIIICCNLYAQFSNISGGMNLLVQNRPLNRGWALNISGEYNIADEDNLRFSTGFVNSQFNRHEFFASNPFSMISFESSYIRSMSKNSFYPFIGAGIGYYLPHSSMGNARTRSDNSVITSYELFSNIGANAIGGIMFTGSPPSLRFEIKYIFTRLKSKINLYNGSGAKYVKYDEEHYDNYHLIFVGFSVVFKL